MTPEMKEQNNPSMQPKQCHLRKPSAISRFAGRRTATLAREAMMSLKTASQHHRVQLSGACVIAASDRVLPDLRKILSSHALIHAAEGEFYRIALLGAAETMGIAGRRLNATEAVPRIASLLRISENTLMEKLDAIGKGAGRPWTSDEKLATMAVWMLLAK